MTNYLTEELLKKELLNLFPNNIFIHNKSVPNSNILSRPDFRCEELKLIIEFDGFRHYNSASQIFMDYKKDEIYKNMGYKIIHIPYFIQLSKQVIKNLFDIDYEYIQTFPHGFIDKQALLPVDFNELGVNRFINDIENTFNFCKKDIVLSLNNWINKYNNSKLVIPSKLIDKIIEEI